MSVAVYDRMTDVMSINMAIDSLHKDIPIIIIRDTKKVKRNLPESSIVHSNNITCWSDWLESFSNIFMNVLLCSHPSTEKFEEYMFEEFYRTFGALRIMQTL